MRSPIIWFGGKGALVNKLIKYVPRHKYYLECFGGAASLLFYKQPVPLEVYNDIDSGLINFFRVFKDEDKFNKFYRKVYYTLWSREEFYFCRDTWRECKDEIEKAYRWFVTVRQGFSGHIRDNSNGWRYNKKADNIVKSWNTLIKELPIIHQRFKSVQIEHLDWKECMNKYNNWEHEGFYYLDPPYVSCTRKSGGYEHELTDDDHIELIEWLLSKCKVKVMLSGYDNYIYESLELNGWRKICWEIECPIIGRTESEKRNKSIEEIKESAIRTECIWINYEIPKTLSLFDKIGEAND